MVYLFIFYCQELGVLYLIQRRDYLRVLLRNTLIYSSTVVLFFGSV